MSKLSPSQLLEAIGAHSAPDPGNDRQNSPSNDGVPEAILEAISNSDTTAHDRYIKSSRVLIRELQILPGEQALVVNGRVGGHDYLSFIIIEIVQVIGPLRAGSFSSADFGVLGAYEMRKRVEPIVKALEKILPSERDKYVMSSQYVHLDHGSLLQSFIRSSRVHVFIHHFLESAARSQSNRTL